MISRTRLDNFSTLNLHADSPIQPPVHISKDHPDPADLDVYLPWACNQLQCPLAVSVIRVTQAEYVSVNVSSKKSAKQKPKQQLSETLSDVNQDDKMVQSILPDEEGVNIYAFYDIAEHLVELKFEKNIEIPRVIFQVLGLIVQFQKHLNTITINQGLDKYSLYEINKFLPISYVTDLCLDNTYLREGNYHVLLESYNLIKRISMARCRINDRVVETIAAKLVHPLPASKRLFILDLSMNQITDKGAKYIANALRSNRCLSYLNLSGNGLTDAGGEQLFNTLINFPLTNEELFTSKQRLMKYYKDRGKLVTQIIKVLRLSDPSKGRRKSIRTQTASRKSRNSVLLCLKKNCFKCL